MSTPGSGSSVEPGSVGSVVVFGVGLLGVGDPVAALGVLRSRALGISTKTAPAKAIPQTSTHASVSATVLPNRLSRCDDTRSPPGRNLHTINDARYTAGCIRH